MRRILLAWAGVLLLGFFSGAVYAGVLSVSIVLEPPNMAFGPINVGDRSGEIVGTFSRGDDGGPPVQIVSVVSGGADAAAFDVSANCNGVELDPNQNCVFTVAFEPNAAADFLANLLIDCRIAAVVTTTVIICEDPTTVATTFTLNTLINYFTGTGVAAAPIPTLGQWGITILALLLAAFMITRLRKTHG